MAGVKRRVKIALLVAVPVALYLILSERLSWRPRQWRGHAEQIQAIAFSPDGQLLASVSLDQTVRLWKVSSRTLLWSTARHDCGIGDATWN